MPAHIDAFKFRFVTGPNVKIIYSDGSDSYETCDALGPKLICQRYRQRDDPIRLTMQVTVEHPELSVSHV